MSFHLTVHLFYYLTSLDTAFYMPGPNLALELAKSRSRYILIEYWATKSTERVYF